MKALYFEEHGERDVLQYGDLPDLQNKEGHVLIKVEACALNHLDIWSRKGWPGLNLEMPHIGGSDVSGTVVEGNGNWKEGDKVVVDPGISTKQDSWTEKGLDSMSPGYRILGEHISGGCAEYVSVPAENIHKRPEGMTASQAAAPLLVGLTAYRMLVIRASIQKGDNVLVMGSGGGVNSLSIQIAKHFGADVHVVAGGSEKKAKAEDLGASFVVDYKANPDWHKELFPAIGRKGYDIVVDNVGKPTWSRSIKLAGIGGRIVTVGNTKGPIAETDIRYIFSKQLSILGSTMGSHSDFAELLKLLESGSIKPVIDCEIPLSDGAKGHQILEEGTMFGKVVIVPD
ncbi:MAG: zinc-binding dehydrogenase [Candidatus Poseidoniia archaeon]|jgi:NADPH2:quinone reductase|nr:zinc-binding dehydrogenase [Candidatus Poseidoniia archaeon]MDP7187564.1 zinc-binding dehydrogenase [Candidatus Poseidoniia archaeon]MDP7444112.1 zinc-binding dehydrogenase [Candidatus Poseidoniia archaeon]MDP7665759.1 zinc-binding dehydrogenase [Candidatus Poseidoniia archaeon]HJN32057.1 zinc-binding dehydrogenase [Candidatus Poseidoniia archaeon]|tara:strand:+ start:19417 stop:20442 length:1026 start_codon:yes stop_codon:yes gene_type:complete